MALAIKLVHQFCELGIKFGSQFFTHLDYSRNSSGIKMRHLCLRIKLVLNHLAHVLSFYSNVEFSSLRILVRIKLISEVEQGLVELAEFWR